MGYGDEIMASGFARVAHAKNGLPVGIFDIRGNLRSHAVWENNPYIITKWDRKSPITRINNSSGARHYIRTKTESRWFWQEHCEPPPPGELFFSEAELYAVPLVNDAMVLLEPNNKPGASVNKDWGFSNWQKLCDLLCAEGLRPVQLGPAGTRVLSGAQLLPTGNFRIACATLASFVAAVLPEGGLHHAAAAVGLPSVVIYGGFISPQQTGYNAHVNIFTGGSPCGMRVSCKHCEKAMRDIDPHFVLKSLLDLRTKHAKNLSGL